MNTEEYKRLRDVIYTIQCENDQLKLLRLINELCIDLI